MEELNKRLCKKLGIEWHEDIYGGAAFGAFFCSCRRQFPTPELLYAHIAAINPDFKRDPVALLRVMMEREDYDEFTISLFSKFMFSVGASREFARLITDTTGKLALAADERLPEPGGIGQIDGYISHQEESYE